MFLKGLLLGTTVCLLTACGPRSGNADTRETDYETERRAMVREIAADVRRTSNYLGKNRLDDRVMDAMGRVERHRFVPESIRDMAYLNRPLPIGHDQTISQPYIVAIMTDLLGLDPGCRVLEVGTGSGYQAAVLAELCDEVFTIEIVAPLGQEADERLARLGYENVNVRIGDGYAGWPEEAPFDGIIVTAGASHVPDPLVEQLARGARIVIPVGDPYGRQDLVVVTKQQNGDTVTREILPVIFVPLTGGHD